MNLTPHHAKYFAHDLTRRAATGIGTLALSSLLRRLRLGALLRLLPGVRTDRSRREELVVEVGGLTNRCIRRA